MKSDFTKSQLEKPDHEIWFHEIPIEKNLQIMKSDFMKPHLKKHQIVKSDFMKPQLKTTPDHEIRFHETPIEKTPDHEIPSKQNSRSWNPISWNPTWKKHQVMKSDFMKPQLKTTPDYEIRFSWNPN